MSETVCVNFSGPAMAFLLYENIKAEREQEGFLLGDTNVIVTKTITDSESDNVILQKIITVNGVVPCPRTCLIYNSAGQINKEQINLILGTQLHNVVAWFRYEPSNKLKLTMRAKLVHKALGQYFDIAPELFSCCLLSSTSSQLKSTHQYSHTLLRWSNKQFETVPFHIDNLGQLCNSYKPKMHSSKIFSELCNSIGLNKRDKHSDWELIGVIQDKLRVEIKNTMDQLVKSEQKVLKRDLELQQLRNRLECQRAASLAEKEAPVSDKKVVEESIESVLILVDGENNKMLENRKCDLKLNDDVELVDEVKYIDEVKILVNGNVLVKNSSGDVAKYKMPKEFVNIIKTDEESVIVVDTTNGCASNATTPTIGTSQLIDLTMDDDDVTPPRSYKKISYAQATSTAKLKKTNTTS